MLKNGESSKANTFVDKKNLTKTFRSENVCLSILFLFKENLNCLKFKALSTSNSFINSFTQNKFQPNQKKMQRFSEIFAKQKLKFSDAECIDIVI